MHNFVEMQMPNRKSPIQLPEENTAAHEAFSGYGIYGNRLFTWFKNPVYVLVVVFIISRVLAYLAGVFFYMGFFRWGPQCLDIPLLQNKLWESIWYMHGQPPLFNLYIASVINIFPAEIVKYIFQACWLGLGLLHSILLYKTIVYTGVGRKIALLAAMYFVISPAAILYENLFYYTQIELFMLTLSAYLLVKFIKFKSFKYSFLFFLSLAILILTRSMFHWFWLIGAVVLLLLMIPDKRKIILLACVFPVMLSGAWYLKNYVLYGKFASSTWLGMSLANVVKPTDGIAQIKRWENINAYKDFIEPDNRYPNIEVLHTPYQSDSMVNLNYLPYLQVFDQFMEVSVKNITTNPLSYLKNVFEGHVLFFSPASNYEGLSNNRETLKIYVTIYDMSFANALYRRFTGRNLYIPSFYIALINLLVFVLALRLCILWRFDKTAEKRLQFLIMIFLL
ncbi:MAG: hypothetical protein ACXWEY_06145, partial [Bacteroidia bacterium]